MKICGNCGATFEDDDLIEGKCPDCNSEDVEEAIICADCGDPCPKSLIKVYEGRNICSDCDYGHEDRPEL